MARKSLHHEPRQSPLSELKLEPIASLYPYPGNPRVGDIEAIKESLLANGLFRPPRVGAPVHRMDPFETDREWSRLVCGGGGIRTHERLATPTVFETAPFNHSGTPPGQSRHNASESCLATEQGTGGEVPGGYPMADLAIARAIRASVALAGGQQPCRGVHPGSPPDVARSGSDRSI